VPWYILCVQYYKLKEFPLMALIVPYLFSVFNLIILKSFMSSIPDAIYESAKIDGASHFKIFVRLILPLSKPALATVGLFMALYYWNDWFLTFIFIQDKDYYSLQYFLYRTISAAEAIRRIANATGTNLANIPTESSKMAMTVIATGPILLLYPFLQRYFVKGISIGAVKG
jgi:putative aldouronate transport system permease protein